MITDLYLSVRCIPDSPSGRTHRCAKGTYRGKAAGFRRFESGSKRQAKRWRHLAKIEGTIMID